jgi:hypothetical protein
MSQQFIACGLIEEAKIFIIHVVTVIYLTPRQTMLKPLRALDEEFYVTPLQPLNEALPESYCLP